MSLIRAATAAIILGIVCLLLIFLVRSAYAHEPLEYMYSGTLERFDGSQEEIFVTLGSSPGLRLPTCILTITKVPNNPSGATRGMIIIGIYHFEDDIFVGGLVFTLPDDNIVTLGETSPCDDEDLITKLHDSL